MVKTILLEEFKCVRQTLAILLILKGRRNTMSFQGLEALVLIGNNYNLKFIDCNENTSKP